MKAFKGLAAPVLFKKTVVREIFKDIAVSLDNRRFENFAGGRRRVRNPRDETRGIGVLSLGLLTESS